MTTGSEQRTITVWDLPVRLFHWALVGLFVAAVLTGKGFVGELDSHLLVGYALLVLVLWRLAWGVFGSTYARFSSFTLAPGAAFAFARRLFSRAPAPWIGHNPLAAWNVLALLGLVLAQAVTGLFASDEIDTEGPLATLVSTELCEQLTSAHHLLSKGLFVMVGLHVGAVIFHLVVKKENLVRALITGKHHLPATSGAQSTSSVSLWRALGLAAAAALLVYAALRILARGGPS